VSGAVDFRVLELLCGRLCHELISPVGAINNGVELLDEEDPDFVKEAMGLIGQSARRAGQRLQFYRFAYGTAGASGSTVDPRELVQGLLDGTRLRCEWVGEPIALEVPWQRLACNMVVFAAEFLPRGGTLSVRPNANGVTVAAEGEGVTVSAELKSALDNALAVEALTNRTVHAFFTMRLADHLAAHMSLTTSSSSQAVLNATGT
jgi:histidine phosphotransferase ChpT